MPVNALLQEALEALGESRAERERLRRLAALEPDDPETRQAQSRFQTRAEGDPFRAMRQALEADDSLAVRQSLMRIGYTMLEMFGAHPPTARRPILWRHNKRDDRHISRRFPEFSIHAIDDEAKLHNNYLPFYVTIVPPHPGDHGVLVYFKYGSSYPVTVGHHVKSVARLKQVVDEIATAYKLLYIAVAYRGEHQDPLDTRHRSVRAALQWLKRHANLERATRLDYQYTKAHHNRIWFEAVDGMDREMLGSLTKQLVSDDDEISHNMTSEETHAVQRVFERYRRKGKPHG